MIAFFQTGGIGDAILGVSVVRKLHELYGDISVLYCNHLVPQVYQGLEFISHIRRVDMAACRTYFDFQREMAGYDFVVFNKFRRGRDGKLNFFLPVDDRFADLCRSYGVKYMEALSAEIGRKISDLSEVQPLELVSFFNSETDYFSDWRRYGLDCGYEGVSIDIFPYTEERNRHGQWPEKFVIVHDSKFPVDGKSVYPMKAWRGDRWADLCRMVRDRLGVPIVQILSEGQEKFSDFVLSHDEFIGRDAIFQDYLYMLRRASAYIGTDSWPAHAAIFIRNPAYVLLKGAVSKRWDHGGRYSRIIRTGNCQACEGPWSNASRCMWYIGNPCMESITADMVYAELEKELDSKN